MYRRPGDPLFDSLYTLLGRMEAADFEEARKEDSGLPRLDAAHPFAIVICRSKNRGLHYMLFQRLESGTLVYYDPYKGAPRAASYAIMTGEKAIDPVWVSSGCGILLP
jgi:hypothetical protein